ncbi:hypothetical protein [Sphingomonas humi]|uniref:Uncharacterized protein n=1 Tax=Sphingomonas humi TaxID=335630 RepID=A0ABP7RYG4_9SPHN
MADDLTTSRIMLTSLKTLAKGRALSEKQKAVFIDSIRIRLGKSDFDWHGPVKLTRSQTAGANSLLLDLCTKTLDGAGAAIEQDCIAKVERLEAQLAKLERAVAQLLHQSPPIAASILRNSCTKAAQPDPELLETQASASATKRNETKRNHDGAMIFPLEAMTATSGRHPAANDISSSTADTTERNDGVETGKRRDFSDHAVVSFFRNDPNAEPSANLELKGKRYSLVFHSADVAEERMFASSSREWRLAFDASLGAALREHSRDHARSDERYVLSPLYDETDRFGRKKPVAENCVAVLVWTDDMQPKSVTIIDGDTDIVTVPLSRAQQTKPKSPTHKGMVKLAA